MTDATELLFKNKELYMKLMEALEYGHEYISCVSSDNTLREILEVLSKVRGRPELIAKIMWSLMYFCTKAKRLNIPMEYVIDYATTFIMLEHSFAEELRSIPKVIDFVKKYYGVTECSNVARLPWNDIVDYMLACKDSENRNVRVYVEVTRRVKNIAKICKLLYETTPPEIDRIIVIVYRDDDIEDHIEIARIKSVQAK